MTAYETIESAIDKQSRIQATLVYPGGGKEKVRFSRASGGGVLRLSPGRQRYGRRINEFDLKDVTVILPKTIELSSAEQYAQSLKKWAKYVLLNCHPNLWREIQKQACNVLQTPDGVLLQLHDWTWHDDDAAKRDNARELEKSLNLPHIEQYKTLTLNSCQLPTYYKKLPFTIKEHLDKREEFKYYWTSNYDYHVYAWSSEGTYQACLSQEFKGCGNGHYWHLINANNAVFTEDD